MENFLDSTNAANVQLSTHSRGGGEKENRKYISAMNKSETGRDPERCIKLRVIRHNTLLPLYHSALYSSAPSFRKLWGTRHKHMAQEDCMQLFFKEIHWDVSPPSSLPCLTLLYLKQPVWHWTWLNLSEAKLRYSTCLRGRDRERESEGAEPRPGVRGWVQIPA